MVKLTSFKYKHLECQADSYLKLSLHISLLSIKLSRGQIQEVGILDHQRHIGFARRLALGNVSLMLEVNPPGLRLSFSIGDIKLEERLDLLDLIFLLTVRGRLHLL